MYSKRKSVQSEPVIEPWTFSFYTTVQTLHHQDSNTKQFKISPLKCLYEKPNPLGKLFVYLISHYIFK